MKKQSLEQNDHCEAVRLDKWLWAARFYKTRATAREMIQGGKVRYNAKRGKPSKNATIGDTIELWQGHVKKEIIIEGLSDKRRNFEMAHVVKYLENTRKCL